MSRHLQLLSCQATCNCQHVKRARSKNKKRERREKESKMYINDQAHRYTGYYTSTTLRSGPRPLQRGDSSVVEVVLAFHVGLRGRRREV